jgi:anti-sigma factor RsiW
MQHPDEGTIHAWLDGALSPEEAARVEAHANECPECAAAVAEARGFIAASSRILTALDNVPRGVIPAAPARRRVDPFVWRIAATLLVVAAGTLVVVRTQGTEKRSQASVADTVTPSSALSAAETAQATMGTAANSSEAAPTASVPAPQAMRTDGTRKAQALPPPIPAARGAVTDLRGTVSGGGLQDNQRRGALNKAAADAAMPAPAPAAPPAAADFAQMDRVAPAESLRVIATPRRIGASVTVYEIGGDTVTLTESQHVSLQSVVVTGAVAARQATEKAAVRPPRTAPPAAAAAAAAPDSQTRVLSSAVPTAAVVPGRGGVGAQAANVITWSDPATGSTFTLTGKISPARLEQVKLKIERERAAAAAARKNP